MLCRAQRGGPGPGSGPTAAAAAPEDDRGRGGAGAADGTERTAAVPHGRVVGVARGRVPRGGAGDDVVERHGVVVESVVGRDGAVAGVDGAYAGDRVRERGSEGALRQASAAER